MLLPQESQWRTESSLDITGLRPFSNDRQRAGL